MELPTIEGPPIKKRRFFNDEEPASSVLQSGAPSTTADTETDKDADSGSGRPQDSPAAPEEVAVAFNIETIEAFTGDTIKPDIFAILQQHSNNDLQRAVNMYLDGAYKAFMKKPSIKTEPTISKNSPPISHPGYSLQKLPDRRYIGAFGVEGWATRSGTNILKHGDVVKIERQKIQPPAPPKIKSKLGVSVTPTRNTAASRRVDVIVRFTNESGFEIGRLAKDTANWVSTLIDQKICHFEGSVVYAPDRIRTNDTIFLQLKCSLLKSAFFSRSFQLPEDGPVGYFEQSESADEKKLRLRQVALVRLFQETGLQPSVANTAAKDNRQGLLRAAEMDEEKQTDAKTAPVKDADSPGSEDPEDGKELEQDQLDALYKKAQSFDFDTPEAEPADTFAMTLRPYQKQSLHWMMSKEKDTKNKREHSMHPLWEEYIWPTKDHDDQDVPTVGGITKFYMNPYSGDLSVEFPVQEQHCLGGLLADEMGLGKTIQMLSLIHSHRSEVAREARSSLGGLTTVNQLPRLGASSATLLDAPCTTLIIAPMSLLSQWQSEAQKASKEGTLKIELYYGNEKTTNLQALCCTGNASMAPDLVITSYGVILSEFSSISSRNGDKSFHKGIFSLNFFRVILDEAHYIKNRSSKTARACYEITAAHRWVLTGTPIVNKLEDLFSLVRFLGVEPWNNFSFWKTFITVPFEAGDFVRALNVVQTVLEPLAMRRTKDMKTPNGEPLVLLPPKQIDVVEVELSKTERDVYDYIYHRAKRTFNKNMEAGTVMKAFTTIFAQILRLRQSCCHPILVRNKDLVADEMEAGAVADAGTGFADDMDLENLIQHFTAVTDEASKDNQAYGVHALSEIRDESEKECPFCFEEPMNDQTVTGCWHSACKQCLLDFMKHETDRGTVPKCFSCRAPLNSRDLFEVVRYDDEPDPVTGSARISLQRLGMSSSSSKVSALMSQLRTLRKEFPRMKSVVFSQFTSFLSLIEPALARANITFLRLDGSMSQRARAAVLNEFTEKEGFMILLISLRAGGVGLNLTSAGRVYMMDPWWSFAVESQAIDRVHRLGQDDEVQVKRFIVKESVEERMLKIQERKKFIATSLGMMSDEEKRVQRIEDIKELLS